MRRLVFFFVLPALFAATKNPFVGRWDFTVTTSNGVQANWLGISEKNGQTEVWFQPTGGHVRKIDDYRIEGTHLTLTPAKPAAGEQPVVWELDANHGQLTGVQKHGDTAIAVVGMPAPELKRAAPKKWSTPEPLFNGKDLSGWEPIGDPGKSHWVVEDGMLVNKEHGANLKTTRKFDDFKLHFEVNCPDDANSGVYLRGRYEVQMEYVPAGSEPPEREMGSIYGRIAPVKKLPRTPGQWETFDVTFVGRTVTIARNGVTTIDHKEIEGITGGALDAREAEPGPLYIQGDHTGGLKFRNVTISVPGK